MSAWTKATSAPSFARSPASTSRSSADSQSSTIAGERRARKTETEHRRGQQRLAVLALEFLDARQHERLHRARHRGLAGIRGAEQLIEKERMTLRAPDAARHGLFRQLRIARREFARLLVGERREIERRQRAAARPRAPGGVDRILIGPRGEDEERGLRSDGGRKLAEARRFFAAGVMQVLDHEQERRARAGRFDQAPHDVDAAVLERLRVHILFDRRLIGGERRADQPDRMQDAFRGQAAGGDRIRDGASALDRIGIRTDAEQAREQARERAPRLDLSEVQHLHAVAFRSVRPRRVRERFEQARLADARLAAGHDRAAAPRRDRALEERRHEREFRVATRKTRVARAERAPQFVGEQ